MCVLKANNQEIRVITYDTQYKNHFAQLNFQWIEKFFHIEEEDRKYLENPQKIIDEGGEIFFILYDNEVKGTCALIKAQENVYELAKMAVAPDAQGKGLSKWLMQAVMDWAKEKKAKKLFLVSSTTLTPALNLYEKYGFVTTKLGKVSKYERGDIRMDLEL